MLPRDPSPCGGIRQPFESRLLGTTAPGSDWVTRAFVYYTSQGGSSPRERSPPLVRIERRTVRSVASRRTRGEARRCEQGTSDSAEFTPAGQHESRVPVPLNLSGRVLLRRVAHPAFLPLVRRNVAASGCTLFAQKRLYSSVFGASAAASLPATSDPRARLGKVSTRVSHRELSSRFDCLRCS